MGGAAKSPPDEHRRTIGRDDGWWSRRVNRGAPMREELPCQWLGHRVRQAAGLVGPPAVPVVGPRLLGPWLSAPCDLHNVIPQSDSAPSLIGWKRRGSSKRTPHYQGMSPESPMPAVWAGVVPMTGPPVSRPVLAWPPTSVAPIPIVDARALRDVNLPMTTACQIRRCGLSVDREAAQKGLCPWTWFSCLSRTSST